MRIFAAPSGRGKRGMVKRGMAHGAWHAAERALLATPPPHARGRKGANGIASHGRAVDSASPISSASNRVRRCGQALEAPAYRPRNWHVRSHPNSGCARKAPPLPIEPTPDISAQLKLKSLLAGVCQRDLLKLRCRSPHLKPRKIQLEPRTWLEPRLGSNRSQSRYSQAGRQLSSRALECDTMPTSVNVLEV